MTAGRSSGYLRYRCRPHVAHLRIARLRPPRTSARLEAARTTEPILAPHAVNGRHVARDSAQKNGGTFRAPDGQQAVRAGLETRFAQWMLDMCTRRRYDQRGWTTVPDRRVTCPQP